MDFTQGYIAELEQKIERLERHNAIFHPEYDPVRDEPLDVTYEAGRQAAWRDVADLALTRLVGEEHDKALRRLERERADLERELRELWEDHMERPFPNNLYLPDVVKVIRRRLSRFALVMPGDEE